MKETILAILKNERGVSAIIVVTFILLVGIGIIAFVIDIGYLNVVKNEIQNAADAGALAGANELILSNGDINEYANQTAFDTATSNKSGGNAVEVNWTYPENNTDVQRGHWTPVGYSVPSCPSLGGAQERFCPNANLNQVALFIPNHEYWTDTNFINAVRVVTHNTHIPSFFGKIWGHSGYQRTSDAVAVRTVPGNFQPGDFDYPIAICIQSITDDSGLNCNIGRMINSGTNQETHNTAGWTNFTQPCVTASAGGPGAVPTDCGEGNSGLTEDLTTGVGMGTTGGELQSVLTAIRNCFFDPTTTNEREDENGDTISYTRDQDDNGIVDTPLIATLPVIDCPGNNISNCATLLTGVKVQIVWISEGGTGQLTSPTKMYKSGFPAIEGDDYWEPPYDPSDVSGNWADFISAENGFNLKNVDGDDAPLQKKAIYFKPECEVANTAGSGGTGGPFMGIWSKTSVLVE